MRVSKVFAATAALALATGCQHAATAEAAPAVANHPGSSAAPFATPPVLAGQADIASLVAKVRPAVVNITTVHEVKVSGAGMGASPFSFFFGEDAPDFFKGFQAPGRRSPRGDDHGDRTLKQRALGSGFIVDARGYVVTNAHVVDGADKVRVKLADDREFKAKVKGRDTRLDLAVLELEGAKDLPHVPLGSSEGVRVGEWVVAIGNPFGLGNTVTQGIVSAKGRAIGAGPYDDFIQTDASINPGNSGGPLFNLKGEVVGINTAINPQGQGIGFAIPSDSLKDVLPQLIKDGHVERGRLGVMIQPVDGAMAQALGMKKAHGALVGQVDASGPAAKAGLETGDVIEAVDGEEVPRSRDLPRIVARHAPGSHVKVKVLRDGVEKTIPVTLGALEGASESDDSAPRTSSTPKGSLGIAIEDGKNGGAVVTRVMPNSPAAGQLRPGDEILEVDRKSVKDAGDLSARIKAAPDGKPVLLLVRRDGQTHYVAIERAK